MFDRHFSLPLAVLVLFAGFGLTLVAQDSSSLDSTHLNGINWRAIGPAAFGGRIDDVEAIPGNPNVIFVAAASGGIFRSTNKGVRDLLAASSMKQAERILADRGFFYIRAGDISKRLKESERAVFEEPGYDILIHNADLNGNGL